jgi:hypothetical protein
MECDPAQVAHHAGAFEPHHEAACFEGIAQDQVLAVVQQRPERAFGPATEWQPGARHHGLAAFCRCHR